MGSIKAVDLFCGVGGLTHGLIQAGIDVIAGIDQDASCRFAYEANNPAKFIQSDIRTISAKAVMELYPPQTIQVLCGCAPCQPFSKHTQKKRKQTRPGQSEDQNWGLLTSFADIIRTGQPDIVSMENVFSITKEAVFKDFLALLAENHYHASWKNVYCPDYGIPQNRKRLVCLASKKGKIRLVPPTHNGQTYPTPREFIGGLPPLVAGGASSNDILHRASKLTSLNLERIRQSKPGGTWRDWHPSLVARCHQKLSGKSYSGVYARMEWDKPSPTVTTQFFRYGTGRFGHPEQDRALSLREGALLQTFPESYQFVPQGKTPSFTETGRHIGNAVPVTLGFIIGQSIIEHVQGHCDNSI